MRISTFLLKFMGHCADMCNGEILCADRGSQHVDFPRSGYRELTRGQAVCNTIVVNYLRCLGDRIIRDRRAVSCRVNRGGNKSVVLFRHRIFCRRDSSPCGRGKCTCRVRTCGLGSAFGRARVVEFYLDRHKETRWASRHYELGDSILLSI